MRNLDFPGRSAVRGTQAMVSASHPAASLAAVEILRRGGNAMDAAITATAVLGVVEPYNLGVGGDSFVLYRPAASGRIVAYNGSGRAPAAASLEHYRAAGCEVLPIWGPHAAVVPGAVDAWVRLAADHGRLGLDALLEPAAALAENGAVVHDVVAYWWRTGVIKLRRDATAAAIFLVDGEAPTPGTVHRHPRLAETLRDIGRRGRSAFYTGPVAEDMVATLRSQGGLHTLDDFATAEGNYVEPIKASYKDLDVYECPPNGQGVAVLMMLKILDGLPRGAHPLDTSRLHGAIEAGRLAMRERDRLIGDPAFGAIPIEDLLSAATAAALRGLIDPTRAMAPLPPSPFAFGKDTSHTCVVDRDGNAASFISSLFHEFGCGVVCPRSGVTLNNRASGFVLVPGHPNAIGPRKRPLHTIIPGMAIEPGRAIMPFGVVGGHYQPWGHAHVLINLVDFGLDVQQALDLPRLFHNGERVEAETGIPEACMTALQAMGHTVTRRLQDGPGDIGPLGGGQLIRLDFATGVLSGAADARMDGCALGY